MENSMSSELNIYIRNISSVRENFDNLIAEFNALGVLLKYNVIVLTETWIYAEEQPRYFMDGYTSYLQPRLSGRSGGVMIFVKNELKVNSKCFADRSFEAVAIELAINNSRNGLPHKISIFGVYRSHHCSVSTFLEDFLPAVNSVSGVSIVVGDLNVNLLNQDEPNVSRFIDSSSLGYLSLHSEVTRPESQTCLDHVLLKSDNFLNCNVKILDCFFSDHCPIELSIDNPIQCKRPSKIVTTNYEEAIHLIKNTNWNHVTESHSAATAFQVFFNILDDIKTNSKKTITLNSKNKRRSPWVTDVLVKKINRKNELSKLCRRHQSNTDLQLEFKYMSASIKKEIKSAKFKYTKDRILEAVAAGGCNVGKVCWRIINTLKGQPKRDIGIIEIDGDKVNSSDDAIRVANHFNDYYVGIAQRTIDEANENQSVDENVLRIPWTAQSFFLREITVHEIVDIINSLKSKSNSNDTILNPLVLKQISQFIAPILKHLFNLSLQQGLFPPQLKHATVIPIFKKGDKTKVENYRPISLLPTISKIFEKIVKNLVLSFIDELNFFSNCQFGFQKGKNVNLAVYKQIDVICEAIEEGYKVSGLYIDLKKAFDLVSHDILLDKLYKYGFRSEMYHWFKSYLCHRTQSVKIHDSLSKPLNISYGVPQGSVLGPILFLMFINDIFLLPFQSYITCFADDTSLICRARNYKDLGNMLRNDIAIISSWFVANKMVPNSSKTELLIYSLISTDQHDLDEIGPIYLHNQRLCTQCNCSPIVVVENVRYLGVFLDSRLNWSKHISQLVQKLAKVNYGISYLSKHITPSLLRVLYYSWFQSVLSFGITHWGGTFSTYFKVVTVCQKNALRTINGLPFSSHERTQPLFDLWGFMPVKDLYYYYLGIFMFKYSHLFEKYNNDNRLRQRNSTFKILPYKKEHIRKQCPYLGPVYFNSLPMHIQSAQTLNRFKFDLHNHIWSLTFN